MTTIRDQMKTLHSAKEAAKRAAAMDDKSDLFKHVLTIAGQQRAVPPAVLEALTAYRDHRIRPGSFTRAVLENDLHLAVMNADSASFEALRQIMTWVYFELPSKCWGSKAAVRKWLEGGS